MRPVWKWLLGIIIVVILLCGVAAGGAFAFYRLGGVPWIMNARAARPSFGGQVLPPFQMPLRPNGRLPMMPYGRMYGYRFGGLFPLGFFVRPLFCLGFLALLALIALVVLLSQRRPPAPAPAAVAAAPVGSTAVEPTAAATEAPAAAARSCPSCGRAVNEDWSHCPYCGSPLG
jgi:hypothetical protein